MKYRYIRRIFIIIDNSPSIWTFVTGKMQSFDIVGLQFAPFTAQPTLKYIYCKQLSHPPALCIYSQSEQKSSLEVHLYIGKISSH